LLGKIKSKSIIMSSDFSYMYDVFEPTPQDNSTDQYSNFRLTPTGRTYQEQPWSSVNLLEFFLQGQQRPVNFERSYLNLNCQIVQSGTQTAFPAGSAVALVPYVGTQLFSKVEVVMGDSSTIESTHGNQHHTNLVRKWVSGDGSYYTSRHGTGAHVSTFDIPDDCNQQQNSALSGNVTSTVSLNAAGAWSAVTGTPANIQPNPTGGAFPTPPVPANFALAPANFTVTSNYPAPAINTGFVKRQKMTDNGRMVNIRVPLREICSVCQIDRINMGRNVTFRFTTNNVNQLIQNYTTTGAGGAITPADIWIKAVEMTIMSVKGSLEVSAKLMEQIKDNTSQEIVYPYWDTWNYPNFIGLGNDSNQVTITNVNERPLWVILRLVPSGYQSNQNVNPCCSYFPAQGATNTLPPFTGTYIQFGGSRMLPESQYGTFISDSNRIYQQYLDICSKLNGDLPMVPMLGYDDFFSPDIGPSPVYPPTGATTAIIGQGGAAMLVFDMRYVGDSDLKSFSKNTNKQLQANIKFNNTIAANLSYDAFFTICFERRAVIAASGEGVVITQP